MDELEGHGMLADATKRRGALSTDDPCQATSQESKPFLTISILREPDVLELLVRVLPRRRDVVLHFRQMHHVPHPPEPGHVVRILQHDLLELSDELLALGGIERSRLRENRSSI